MTIPEYCILIAALLPHLTVAYAKVTARNTFNNADPRNPAGYADEKAARANAAHLNGFESFPLFAVAVLLAEFHSVSSSLLTLLCVAFIVVRILYVIAYIEGWPNIRSTLFTFGITIAVVVFLLPLYT